MSSDNPTDTDRIEYLILRRYPGARRLKFPPSLNTSRGYAEDTSQARANVAAYRAELSTLAPRELDSLYMQERKREAETLARRAEEREQALPFNQPYAVADFHHWSRAAHWTLDEAIALSFGKAPEVVSWEKVKSHVQVSPFAAQYARRRDLALRAAQWQQVFDPVLPGIFLGWCKRFDIPVPAALEAAVASRGVLVADWPKLLEESQAAAERRSKEWSDFAEKQRADWSAVVNDRDKLISTRGSPEGSAKS